MEAQISILAKCKTKDGGSAMAATNFKADINWLPLSANHHTPDTLPIEILEIFIADDSRACFRQVLPHIGSLQKSHDRLLAAAKNAAEHTDELCPTWLPRLEAAIAAAEELPP